MKMINCLVFVLLLQLEIHGKFLTISAFFKRPQCYYHYHVIFVLLMDIVFLGKMLVY